MKSFVGNISVEVVADKTVSSVVNDIVKCSDQEEPFFIVDLADVIYKYKMWKLKMPRVQPYYAVKCNDCPAILSLLAGLGTGFDCASKVEIDSVLDMGVEPSRIIYANPCKTKSFIKHAASTGVDLMTFDNAMELHKVKAIYPEAKLVIRIRVDDSSSLCRLGLKFGCDMEDVPGLLETAKDLNLDVVGVSFHVGSGCQDANAFNKAIVAARQAFDIAAEVGYHMELLDIGGGFPGTKGPYISFDEISNVVNETLEDLFPPEMGVRIIAEPGRYFVASAFTLCTNIIAKREVMEDGGESCCMYYVNDGVYGSFNCLIFDHAEVQPLPLVNLENRPVLRSSLWGPTCDSLDRIMETCYLPMMNVGEWLVFENMGAYTVAAASTFNGFQKPMIKCILPSHVIPYLQKLPTWSQLVKIFDAVDVELCHTSFNEDHDNMPSPNLCLLPHAESVSA